MKQIYGLDNISFVPIGSISVYTLLDQGKATGGDGFSTDPQQLNTKKYTALVGRQAHLRLPERRAGAEEEPAVGSNGALLASTANAVSAKLTLAAMQAMNKAYVVDKKTPKEIANAFLSANGLK